jgi:murein DD-endopeptidase MepM/ murein hydrolase activator NlpD
LLAGQAGFSRGAGTTITVKRGDTLWDLSRRYGVSMDQLASANHMQVSDLLLEGRTLEIPTGGADRSDPDGSPTAGSGSAAAGAGGGAAHGGAETAATLAAAQRAQRTFCDTYQPPTGSRPLPAGLSSDSKRLALRPLFARWAEVYGVPVDLMEAEAWQESGWSNDVVSPAGARGIGQILPSTAKFMNQVLGTHLKLGVPSDNIQMMAAFLGYLLQATGGQVCGAVASYYEGLATLQRVGVLPVSQVYVRDVLSLRPRFR